MAYKDNEKKKARAKAWYEANKERLKEQQKAYREANKEQIKEQQKAYREANKEQRRVQRKAYYEANKEQRKKKVRAYRKVNKERIQVYRESNSDLIRNGKLLRKYGFQLTAYNGMLDLQGHVCAVCQDVVEDATGRGQTLHVDHCHETGRARELLCGRCNTALGLFRDREDLLTAAIAYLQKHKRRAVHEERRAFYATS